MASAVQQHDGRPVIRRCGFRARYLDNDTVPPQALGEHDATSDSAASAGEIEHDGPTLAGEEGKLR